MALLFIKQRANMLNKATAQSFHNPSLSFQYLVIIIEVQILSISITSSRHNPAKTLIRADLSISFGLNASTSKSLSLYS